MTMAFKYQVSLCLRPNDVLLVTLNHMDIIRSFVEDSPPVKQQVEQVYRLLAQVMYVFSIDVHWFKDTNVLKGHNVRHKPESL